MNTVIPDGMVVRVSSVDVLHHTYRLYRGNFWYFFRVTAPAALVSFFLLTVFESRAVQFRPEITRDLFIPGGRERFLLQAAEMWAILLAGFFVSWVTYCFAGAAICGAAASHQRKAESDWQQDGYSAARQRFGAIVWVAVVTFIVLVLGVAAAWFVGFAVAGRAGMKLFAYAYTVSFYLTCLLVLAWTTRYCLSLPVLMNEDLSPRQAIRKGVRLSGNHEGLLLLLILESVVGTYAAVLLTYRLVPTFLEAFHVPWFSFEPWLLAIIAALASAAVQPVLPVGCAVLCEELQSAQTEADASASVEPR